MSSLAALQAEVESYRTQAGQLADDFTQRQAEVADNPNLTTVGKREYLEPYHFEVMDQISKLHAREKAAVKSAKEKLERQVFGLSPSAANDPARLRLFREAQASVRELEDRDDAEAMYQSALRSGDTILATAVLEKALVRGWSTIKDDFLSRNAGTSDALEDLAALAKYETNSLFNTAHYMPPSLNLPYSAGFQRLGGQTIGSAPRGVPSLADEMKQRLGMSR